MWGGGMTFPIIVVHKESKHILDDVQVRIKDEGNGYYSADSIETITKLCSSAIDAGTRVFNTISVEDVLLKGKMVNGFVINWSAIEIAKLHVDPISIRAKYCIDATGHAAEICNIVRKKVGPLNTPSGDLEKERSMCAELGEKTVVENTKEAIVIIGLNGKLQYISPQLSTILKGMQIKQSNRFFLNIHKFNLK